MSIIGNYEQHKIKIEDINKYVGPNIIFQDQDANHGGTTVGYLGEDDKVTLLLPFGSTDVTNGNLTDEKTAKSLDPILAKYCLEKGLIKEDKATALTNGSRRFQVVNKAYQNFEDEIPVLVNLQLAYYDEAWINQLENNDEKAEAYHQYAYLLEKSAFFNDVVNTCVFSERVKNDEASYKETYNSCSNPESTISRYHLGNLPQFIQAYKFTLLSLELRNPEDTENAKRTIRQIASLKEKIYYCLRNSLNSFIESKKPLDDSISKQLRTNLGDIYHNNNPDFWNDPQEFIRNLETKTSSSKTDTLYLEFYKSIQEHLTW